MMIATAAIVHRGGTGTARLARQAAPSTGRSGCCRLTKHPLLGPQPSEAGHQQQGCDALLFPSSFTPDPPILCDQGTSQHCFRRHDRLNAVRIATARQTSSTQQKLWLIQPQLQLSRHCLFYVILFYLIFSLGSGAWLQSISGLFREITLTQHINKTSTPPRVYCVHGPASHASEWLARRLASSASSPACTVACVL
ncbi:hypothetical protein L1887_62025 [Cichorium endivia]|nr:hypothetical protein L1887_62025 [Cichorium endivia]